VVADLLIAGAGGFARETAAAVRAINEVRPTFRLLGFLDDDPALQGTERAGLTILGGLSLVQELPAALVVVCIGSPRDHTVRARVVGRLALPARRYAKIVHPSASVGTGCVAGHGSVLLAQTVLTADVVVGAHVAVMPHAALTHDDVVEDYATIASGVRLGGAVRLGAGAYIGAGALIRESVRVGAGALVGMGAVVLDEVPAGEVWAGNPARRLRARPAAPTATGVAPVPDCAAGTVTGTSLGSS
jgi:sugar O-acyltransferase (sialic acid O-acetyltransferase NeuD family)